MHFSTLFTIIAVVLAVQVSAVPLTKRFAVDGEVLEVLRLINQARGRGNDVCLEPRLMQAALEHSQDQARTRTMSHIGSDGSSFSDRLRQENYPSRASGENVAVGYTSAGAVVQGWLDSPGHRANIMNRGFSQMGIASFVGSDGRKYWTQLFGAGLDSECIPSTAGQYGTSGNTAPQTNNPRPANPARNNNNARKQNVNVQAVNRNTSPKTPSTPSTPKPASTPTSTSASTPAQYNPTSTPTSNSYSYGKPTTRRVCIKKRTLSYGKPSY